MESKKIKSIIENINNGKSILTDIELDNGVLFQFTGGYMVSYFGCATIRQYVGTEPSIELESNIWGDEYLTIGFDYARIKPSMIRCIDTYQCEEPEN